MLNQCSRLPQIIIDKNINTNYASPDCDTGDCACGITNVEASHLMPCPKTGQPQEYTTASLQKMADSSPVHRTNFNTIPLNDNYTMCYNTSYNTQAVLNHPALDLLSFFNQPNLLNDIPNKNEINYKTLQQSIKLGLLIPENHTPHIMKTMPETLSTWLHLTDRCNLRCAYCYLPHQNIDMTWQVGKLALETVFRLAVRHSYKKVKLKYAGGEAMLRFPFIIKLHQHAKNLAAEHAMDLNGIILGNGTILNASMLQTIRKMSLQLMISLDGLGKYQDGQRFYASGKGTANDVIQSVMLALQHGIVPYISVTVTGQNVAGLPQLMDWLLEHDLPFNLNFYREHGISSDLTEHGISSDLSGFGNLTSLADLKLEEETIVNGMTAAFKVIENHMPNRNLLNSLVDRANLSIPHLRTCNIGQSYFAIDPLGQISKCHTQQHHPIATIYDDDPLTMIQADKTGIQNMSVNEKITCQSCEWKYWCAGGCPIVTYQASGRYDVSSPNCRIYKQLYQKAMRLEGLRLLKYANT